MPENDKKLLVLVFILTAIFFSLAFFNRNVEALEIEELNNEDFEFELMVEDKIITSEQSELMVVMYIKNISEDTQDLKFYNGQKFDVYLKDLQGEIIATWSENKGFTAAIIEKELKPNESKEYVTRVSLEKIPRKSVFQVQGEYKADNLELKSDKEKVFVY